MSISAKSSLSPSLCRFQVEVSIQRSCVLHHEHENPTVIVDAEGQQGCTAFKKKYWQSPLQGWKMIFCELSDGRDFFRTIALLGHIIPEKFASILPPSLPARRPSLLFPCQMGFNWVDPKEAQTDPARARGRHQNKDGNGGGGGGGGLSIASYFRSAGEGSVGPKRNNQRTSERTKEPKVYYFGGRPIEQFRQEVRSPPPPPRRILRL